MPDWELREPAPELAHAYRRAGWWNDDSLGQLVERGLRAAPGAPVRIWSRTRPWAGTLGDLLELSTRFAGGLRSLGVGPGDVVAVQLPNWIEGAATWFASSMLGAIVVPIVHYYGTSELSYILGESHARVLVIAERFGSVDHLANLEAVRPGLDALEHVVVVGDALSRELDPVRRPSRRRSTRHVGDRRSREPRGRRVHLGHERQPERCHPVAPFARRRGADPHVAAHPTRSSSRAPGRAHQSRHRHAARAPAPGVARRTDPPDRRLGPDRRARRDAHRRSLGGQRRDGVPHQPARTSGVLRRPPRADDVSRPRRLVGAHDDRDRRRGTGHPRGAIVRAHRAPDGERREPRRAGRPAHQYRWSCAPRGRDACRHRRRRRRRDGRSGRDRGARTRSLLRLHRRRAHRRVPRPRRMVRDR